MKIIWLTTQFPNGSVNKNGMFIYRTLNELSFLYSIIVINLYPKIIPLIPATKKIKYFKKIISAWYERYPKNPIPPPNTKFKVHYFKYYRLPRHFFHFIEGWFSYLSVKEKINDILFGKTILHATWLFPEGDLANIIYKKHKIPFVVTLMGSDVHFLKVKSKKWQKTKEIIKNAAFITSVSTQLYIDLEKKGIEIPEEKKHLTHTIYEFDKFKILNKKEIRTELNLSGLDKIIFYAGTLRDIKNVDLLITAFAKLLQIDTQYRSNLKLLIAGKGEEEGKLKSLVNTLNIGDKVKFVGGLSGEEIVKYYNAADVFCLPSKNEGLPNVIVEALLCGTPVVASSVGEIPHIIQNGQNGYLTIPNSIDDLKEVLQISLFANWNREDLRESVKWLSPENVIKEYKYVYSEMEKIV